MLLLQGPNEMRRALLVVAAATAATQTRTWRTLRLYHINPLRFDADDIADKDLGDAAGDAFFDISSITNYYACASGARRAPGVVCANAETTGPDIGVTEVEVEVEGAFGPYGTCNICGDDGARHWRDRSRRRGRRVVRPLRDL